MAQRITVEEFNNSDYTKNALKELNEQMKTFKFKTTKAIKNDDESDEISSQSVENYEEISWVAKKPRNDKIKTTKRKLADDHEYIQTLQKRIDKLQKDLNRQSEELDTAEIRLYQTTLNLSNAQVALDDKERDLFVTQNATKVMNKSFLYCRVKLACSLVLNIALMTYCLF